MLARRMPPSKFDFESVLRTRKPQHDFAAIDTETTGLFIHKGCRAFMLGITSSSYKSYVWRFQVNPYNRTVVYPLETLKQIATVLDDHRRLVFHNANYDLQVLHAMGFSWRLLFKHFDIHDTMIMSHAYKSQNLHGLKENALALMEYSDSDEKELETATKQARNIARKMNWALAEKDSDHPHLIGTKETHYRCDYWVPYQLAKELEYPEDHPFFTVTEKYQSKDTERTAGIFLILKELLLSIPNDTKLKYLYQRPWNKKGIPGPNEVTGTLWDKYNEARHLIYPILEMQDRKVPINKRALTESLSLYTSRKSETLTLLRKYAKDPNFNPQSPIQLRKVLFDQFNFEPIKETKSGPSTDKDVISKLLSSCPVKTPIPLRYKFLLALKEFRKEKTTEGYLSNYQDHCLPSKTRNYVLIQPSFSQTRTGTGRLSCTNPNTTNIGKKDMSNPFADEKDKTRATLFSEIIGIDTDDSFTLRNIFGPLPGTEWTCIDYDQFQLRIFAVVSESYDLLEGFERGEDIHQLVAKILFNKTDISPVERTAAKAINFGLLFGAGPSKIELLAGVPGLYQLFMDNFPKAKRYLDTQSRLARTHGYVHTVGGYRLYVPRLTPYAASCYVIQGTEAEIVRNAMVRIHARETQGKDFYKLTMMVHDELIFTSTNTNPKELKAIMDIMVSTGAEIGIPCAVDAKVTKTNWSKTEPLELTTT